MTPEQWTRFERKFHVEPNSGCWLWVAALARGYGYFKSSESGPGYAHRASYEHFIGPIPDGLVLDHVVCDTPCCVNPWHLRPATVRENTLRGAAPSADNARKTHCVRGHEFTPDNITRERARSGAWARRCRACARAKQSIIRRNRRGEEAD